MAGTADLKHLDDRFGQIISSQSESHSMMRTLLTCAGIPFFPSATTTVSPRIGAFPLSFCILARSLFSRRVNFNDYISLDARALFERCFVPLAAVKYREGARIYYFEDSIRSFVEVNRLLTGEMLRRRMRYFLSGCFSYVSINFEQFARHESHWFRVEKRKK